MRARMTNPLQLRHPLALIESFPHYRLLCWLSHKKFCFLGINLAARDHSSFCNLKSAICIKRKRLESYIEIEASAFTDFRERYKVVVVHPSGITQNNTETGSIGN